MSAPLYIILTEADKVISTSRGLPRKNVQHCNPRSMVSTNVSGSKGPISDKNFGHGPIAPGTARNMKTPEKKFVWRGARWRGFHNPTSNQREMLSDLFDAGSAIPQCHQCRKH